jgi:hypothetical protein
MAMRREMKSTVKWLAIISVLTCLFLAVLVPSCIRQEQVDISNTAETQPVEIVEHQLKDGPCDCSSDAPAGTGPAPFGLYADLEFDKPTKINETTYLSWCLKGAETWEQLHAWVQFEYDSGKPGDSRLLPMREVEEKILIEGQLSFDGILKEGEEKYFNAAIKFPTEGKWKIHVRFLGKSVFRDLTQGVGAGIPYIASSVMRLYVTEEYGQFGFPKYYQGEGQVRSPTATFPVSGYVDMEKPPVLNETVQIKWGAGSISDIERVNLHLMFEYLEPGGRKRIPVPPEEIIVSGDELQLISSMSKDEQFKNAFHSPVWNELDKTPRESIVEQSSVHFSSIARFPKEGDWSAILVVGWVDKAGQERKAMMSTLCFNISEDQSAWGWRERH